MGDFDIAGSIAEGDLAAIGAAFDEYAQELYGYCRSRLAEPAEAGLVIQDTFVIASARAWRLRGPARLRAWLFAVARNECDGRLQAGAAPVRLDEGAGNTRDGLSQAGRNPGSTGLEAELRAVVRAALAGLDPLEREIIELSRRQKLAGADLAAVIGVPRYQAHALAWRAGARFGAAMDVVLAARRGPAYCAVMATRFGGRAGDLSALPYLGVWRHVWSCRICARRKRQAGNPAGALGLLQAAALAAGQRQHILRLLGDPSAGAAAYRAQVVQRAGPFGADGFPARPATPRVSRRQGSYVLVGTAAVLALGVLGTGAVLVASSAADGPAEAVVQLHAATSGVGAGAVLPTLPGASSSAGSDPSGSRLPTFSFPGRNGPVLDIPDPFQSTPAPFRLSPTPSPTAPDPSRPAPRPSRTSPDPDPTTSSPGPGPTTSSPDPDPTTSSPDPDPTTSSPDPDPTTSSPDPDPTTSSPDPGTSSTSVPTTPASTPTSTQPAPSGTGLPSLVSSLLGALL